MNLKPVVLSVFALLPLQLSRADDRVMINPIPDETILAASANDTDIHTPIGKVREISEKLDKLSAQNVDGATIAETVAGKLNEQIKKEIAETANLAAKEAIKGAAAGASQSGIMNAVWAFVGVVAALLASSLLKGSLTLFSKVAAIAGKVNQVIKEENKKED